MSLVAGVFCVRLTCYDFLVINGAKLLKSARGMQTGCRCATPLPHFGEFCNINEIVRPFMTIYLILRLAK